ncbi:unnamed protein product, partial [Allacma fusca]
DNAPTTSGIHNQHANSYGHQLEDEEQIYGCDQQTQNAPVERVSTISIIHQDSTGQDTGIPNDSNAELRNVRPNSNDSDNLVDKVNPEMDIVKQERELLERKKALLLQEIALIKLEENILTKAK